MTVIEDELTRTFAALADPTRRAILGRLAHGDATVSELTGPSGLTQQSISKHVKVLEAAGLVSRGQVAQARPCRLEPDRLAEAVEWIARQRQVWSDRYDRLDAHLAELRGEARGEEGAS